MNRNISDTVWETYLKDYSNYLSSIALVLVGLLLIAVPLSAFTGNQLFVVLSAVLALVILLSYLLRKRVGAWIVVGAIAASGFALSVTSLVASALVGAAETYILIAQLIVIVFLPRRYSIAIGAIGILIFLSIGWMVSQGAIVIPDSAFARQTSFSQWIMHAFAMVGFIIIAITLIDRMRSHLFSSVKDLVAQNEKITKIAYFDAVTGLANKARFLTRIQEEIDQGECDHGLVVVLEIRKHRLTKALYGTAVAEERLKAMALMLQEYVGDGYVARIDGGEFAIWNPCGSAEKVMSYFSENRYAARVLLESHACGLPIEINKAIARFPEDGETVEECLLNAELALHDSFQSTTGLRWFAPSMKESLLYGEAIEQNLEKALSNSEFTFVCQPKVELKHTKVVGVEVLCRWSNTELGSVYPGDFIPALTRKALIIRFTLESLRSVLERIDRIDSRFGPEATVSFNVSPAALLSDGFVDSAFKIVEQSSVNPQRIIFEITEDLFIEELQVVESIIRTMYQYGIRTSLDDFGTGYSSLSYISALPISEIKADKAFVSNIAHDRKSMDLFRTVCSMADAFGYSLVAEGVENAEQLSAIQSTSCGIVQGYLFGRPEAL